MKFEPTLHKLSNGISVILDPFDLETVNVKVRFRTGARDETPDEQGITHFCEHMLCKGTRRFPTSKAINEYFDINSGARNAGTSNESLDFYGRILAGNLNILLDFFGDQIHNSLFLPEKIDIERKVIKDELHRSLDNDDRQLVSFVSKTLLGGATYMSHKTLGTFDTLAGFTRGQMLEFLARRLSAKNCIICVSGKIIDPDGVLKCLEKTFAFLPRMEVSENTEIKYTPSVAHNSKPDKNNVRLRVYFPEVWEMNLENRFRRMCASRFERFMINELEEAVRYENGLVYGLGNTGIGNEKLGLVGVNTQTSVDSLEKCVALIAKNSRRIYTENKISDDDLSRYNSRDRLLGADFLESAGRRCGRLIDFYRDFGIVYDYYEEIRLSESIKPKDVIENSRGYFDGAMSIITQGADFDADLKQIWEDNFK
ncbi:MAG: insulinase family protein [Rickettsiales bacterium]|jgi:predicted Zn-dependent peptidase|nr:insulinase family protein [Rickettsiales bacterium]